MNKKFYIIEDEHTNLLQKIDEINNRGKKLGEEKKLACTQTSETWHDNPAFDEVEMQQRMLSKKASDLNNVINNAQILTFNIIRQNNETVTIGKKITILIDGVEEKVFQIGGYETPIKDRVSYNAPIIKPLLGKEVGEEITVNIHGTEKEIEILNIENI